MNIIHHKEFYNMVNCYSGKLASDIISAYNLSFFTLRLNISREDVDEICREECIERGWDPENVTVIYNLIVGWQNMPHDYEADFGFLNVGLSDLIILFNKTKKLKVFL